ncbi:hypothetical protein Tco_0530827 [Tanacetum coccineum]
MEGCLLACKLLEVGSGLALVGLLALNAYKVMGMATKEASQGRCPAFACFEYALGDDANLDKRAAIEEPRNTEKNAKVKVGSVIVRDVRGRYNANNQGRLFQRNNARGNVVAGNAGGQNRDGNDSDSSKTKDVHFMNVMRMMSTDRELGSCFLQNVDLCLEADQCDAFDSDVDEAPTTQTMFMANLTSKEAGPSYDSNTPFEVQDHDTFVDHMNEYHVVTINIIPYDQYVEVNEETCCYKNKVAIGYKNPLCLTRAKQVQPALYNGHVLVMSNHARPVVHDSEDTRDMAEIT